MENINRLDYVDLVGVESSHLLFLNVTKITPHSNSQLISL